jgi:hypothetical protein
MGCGVGEVIKKVTNILLAYNTSVENITPQCVGYGSSIKLTSTFTLSKLASITSNPS